MHSLGIESQQNYAKLWIGLDLLVLISAATKLQEGKLEIVHVHDLSLDLQRSSSPRAARPVCGEYDNSHLSLDQVS